LRAAIGIFDTLGAGPWSEMGRHELAATGETARRRNPATIDELTPQELQIALRVAEGRTTRETAAALFLSPKKSSTTCATSTGNSPSARGANSSGQ
jgi:DNA-binding CsgD family transcriptional regulator